MARKKRPLVPEARDALNHLEGNVMSKKGYHVNQDHPENVKYEVAEDKNIPLQKGYNGDLTSKQAGKVGGNIGGSMVRDMIKMAENSLKNKE